MTDVVIPFRRQRSAHGARDAVPLAAIFENEQAEVRALMKIAASLARELKPDAAGIAALRRCRADLETAVLPLVRPLTSTRLEPEAVALLRGRLRASLGGT